MWWNDEENEKYKNLCWLEHVAIHKTEAVRGNEEKLCCDEMMNEEEKYKKPLCCDLNTSVSIHKTEAAKGNEGETVMKWWMKKKNTKPLNTVTDELMNEDENKKTFVNT